MTASTARRLTLLPSTLPDHEYADRHHLLLAIKEYGTKARLQKVAKLPPTGEVALLRILEYAFDLHDEYVDEHEDEYGWKTYAANRMGIPATTLYAIIRGDVSQVASTTVDRIIKHSGIPARIFYDAEI